MGLQKISNNNLTRSKNLSEIKTISIIIPCRNEKKFIGKCLDSILGLDCLNARKEILVVDGMSEDGSRNIIIDYHRQYPFVRLLTNTKKITPTAFNIGIRNATGEIIVIMGAHATYPPDYLLKSIDVLKKSNADVAGGVVVNCVSDSSLVARAIALITNHPFGVGSSPFRTRKTTGFVDSVAFGTFRISVFEKLGLFDERFTRNQDSEMWGRIIKNGGKIFLDPSIKVYYYNQTSLKGFLRQALWTGMWVPITAKITKKVMRFRHYVPLSFVFYVFITLTIGFIGYFNKYFAFKFIAAFCFMLYLTPWFVSSIQMVKGTPTVKGGLSVLPAVSIILPLYHLFYGLGSVYGVLTVMTKTYIRYLGEDIMYNPPFLSKKDRVVEH